MYKKKIPFDIECGVKITMEVMGGQVEELYFAGIDGWRKASKRTPPPFYGCKSTCDRPAIKRIRSTRND